MSTRAERAAFALSVRYAQHTTTHYAPSPEECRAENLRTIARATGTDTRWMSCKRAETVARQVTAEHPRRRYRAPGPRSRTLELHQHIMALSKAGRSIVQIQRELDLSHTTVYKHVHRQLASLKNQESP